MLKKIKIIMLVAIILATIIPIKIFANTVEYRGEAEGLIAAPNDFFLDFGELLPGDKRSDIVYIQNKTNDKIEVFFKAEPLNKDEYYDEIDYSLLEKIKLKITLNHNEEEQVIYEGNLGAETMSEYISLGEYEKNYDGEFKFEIEVPKELKNSYTLSSTKVKWVFYVEKVDKDDEKNEDTNNKYDKNEEANSEDKNIGAITQDIIHNIKTGDYVFVFIGIICISVIIIIIIAVKNKKSGNRKTKEKN